MTSVDLLKVLTPIVLAFIGGAIGVLTLISKDLPVEKFIAGMGLASSALSGAAGLAQPSPSMQKDDKINKASR